MLMIKGSWRNTRKNRELVETCKTALEEEQEVLQQADVYKRQIVRCIALGLFGTKKTKRRIKEDGSLIVLDKVSKSYSTGEMCIRDSSNAVKKVIMMTFILPQKKKHWSSLIMRKPSLR